MKQTLPKIIPQCPDPVEGQFRAKNCVHLKEFALEEAALSKDVSLGCFVKESTGQLPGGYGSLMPSIRVLALHPWWITRSPLTVINQQLPFFLLLLFLITPADFHSPDPSTMHAYPSTGVLQDRDQVACWALGAQALLSSPTLHPDSNLAP